MGSKSENVIEVQNPRNTNTRTRRPVGEPGRGRGRGSVCAHVCACRSGESWKRMAVAFSV